MNKIELMDYTLDAVCITYGATIQSVLGIILLILSVISAIYKMIYGIYTHIKNKEYNKINEELNNTIKTIDDIKKGDKNNGN